MKLKHLRWGRPGWSKDFHAFDTRSTKSLCGGYHFGGASLPVCEGQARRPAPDDCRACVARLQQVVRDEKRKRHATGKAVR